MRVLVTGAAGRVGQEVVRELRDHEHRVIPTDRAHPASGRMHGLIVADLRDLAEVYDVMGQAKPEAVIHLAANPAPGGHSRHRNFMDNMGMVHAAMQAAGDMGVRQFVFASSEQATGLTAAKVAPPRIPITEDMVIPAIQDYAMGKRLAEVMGDAMAARYPEMGLISLRINYVLTRIRRESGMAEEFVETHKWQSSNLWSYLDIRDAASAFRLAVESRKKGHRIYNVAAEDTSSAVPTRHLIEEHYGKGIEFPDDFPEFGSTIDCSAIRRDLGWVPQYRIRDMIDQPAPEEASA